MLSDIATDAWALVLDDEEAEEAPCRACHGTGAAGRAGDDCLACGGLGVEFGVKH